MIEISENPTDDCAWVETLYSAAFPDEDLVSLVRKLLELPEQVLSLVACANREVIAHCLFTHCTLGGSTKMAALLGPLAIAPAMQRQGMGTALVTDGLRRLSDAGVSQVLVLGDPAYYSRFGFAREDSVKPPYPIPEEWRGAWQSVVLHGPAASTETVLGVPAPWQDRALWAP